MGPIAVGQQRLARGFRFVHRLTGQLGRCWEQSGQMAPHPPLMNSPGQQMGTYIKMIHSSTFSAHNRTRDLWAPDCTYIDGTFYVRVLNQHDALRLTRGSYTMLRPPLDHNMWVTPPYTILRTDELASSLGSSSLRQQPERLVFGFQASLLCHCSYHKPRRFLGRPRSHHIHHELK